LPIRKGEMATSCGDVDSLNHEEKNAPCPEPEKEEEAAKVKTTDEDESDDIACAICFELLVPGDGVLELPCSHLFHSDCIVQWLLNHQHCPICRTLLPPFDFQGQLVSSQQNGHLIQVEENGTQERPYRLTRLRFSRGIRSTTRLLFIQPGRQIKHGFRQFSSFMKLVFHEVSEPFHIRPSRGSDTRNSTRAVFHRRRALESSASTASASGRKKRNIFKRFWNKVVHKSSR
jgi:hypothetical protein